MIFKLDSCYRQFNSYSSVIIYNSSRALIRLTSDHWSPVGCYCWPQFSKCSRPDQTRSCLPFWCIFVLSTTSSFKRRGSDYNRSQNHLLTALISLSILPTTTTSTASEVPFYHVSVSQK